MDSRLKLLDIRKREKINIFLPIFLIITDSFFNKIFNNLFYIFGLGLLVYFYFFKIKCPNCDKEFYKRIYFIFGLAKEKDRTNCNCCNYAPVIASDLLGVDNLNSILVGPIVDLRVNERKMGFHFFSASIFILITAMITYIIFNKSSLNNFTGMIFPGFLAFYVSGLIITFQREYKKIMCPKCNEKIFNNPFFLFKLRKLIKKCECQSCAQKVFIRSYFVTTEIKPFLDKN